MRPQLRATFLIAVAAGVFSCTEPNLKNSQNGDDGPSCPVGQEMIGDGVCATPCVDSSECAADDYCPATTGYCAPRVACDPAACAADHMCPAAGSPEDDGSGACIPIPPECVEDRDCALGERCEGGECISRAGDVVATCADRSECPLGMDCQMGICVGCLDDLQCKLFGAGDKCVLGTCITGGTALACLDANCPSGTQCNPTTGICETTCASDADCEAGEICGPLVNLCVTDPGCVADADCGTGLTCTTGPGFENGVCTGCSDTVSCPTGLRCVLSSCLPDLGGADACEGIACPTGYLCDALDGSCYPENGSCGSNADCRPGHTCTIIGMCAGCSTDTDCRINQSCLFGTCAPI